MDSISASKMAAKRSDSNYGTLSDKASSGKLSRDSSSRHSMLPLGSIGLTTIIWFNVSGGPFMLEDAVGSAGPLFAILGILFVALFYSLPTALMTSELSTVFPEDAGVVAWATGAFGPKLGFTQGMLFWLYGAISLAPYPLMLLDYLRYAVCPSGKLFAAGASYCAPLDDSMMSFLPRNGTLIVFLFVFASTWLNWRGLKLVGATSAAFIVFVLLPFLVLCCVSIPRLHPSAWLRDRPFTASTEKVAADGLDINWVGALQTFVWCLNYMDSTSTLAGEVEQPEKTIPWALMTCLVLVVFTYLLPVLACTAALPEQTWQTGFWVQAGFELGGYPLQWWIFTAALVSFAGQFVAGQATVAYELLGMAELGQVPTWFLERNSEGVPTWSLLLSVIILFTVLEAGSGALPAIVALSNGVYSVAELVNYAAFLSLRWNHPELHRPFRISLGFTGCCLLFLIPAAISISIIVLPFWAGQWFVAGGLLVAASGFLFHSFMAWCRSKYPELFLTERMGTGTDEKNPPEGVAHC